MSMNSNNLYAEAGISVIRNDKEIDLYVTGKGYFQHGRYSGLPENCYPDEGDIEITSIETEDGPWNGTLTDKEHAVAIGKLWENSEPVDDGPEYDKYDEL